jgi:hypothetical protein
MPSSTSGKFHNATQCQAHGQIYHILMFAEILNYLLSLKHNKEKFKSPQQRDAMRCAPIFHDALKCGLSSNSIFTVHEHPMLAGTWVRDTKVEHDIEDRVKEAIARMCERHSGEWTTSKKSKIVLPEPENEMERMKTKKSFFGNITTFFGMNEERKDNEEEIMDPDRDRTAYSRL